MRWEVIVRFIAFGGIVDHHYLTYLFIMYNIYHSYTYWKSRPSWPCMLVGFTTTYAQSVPITTDVVSSNLDQGEVYNIMW
jgi:hypothetical protein